MVKASSDKRSEILERVEARGGLLPGVAQAVSAELGIPEADVFGAASFFHLLSEPDVKLRICQGLSCRMRGSDALLERAKGAGLPVAGCSCLAACDRAPAALRQRTVVPSICASDIDACAGDWTTFVSAASPGDDWTGPIGPKAGDPDKLAMNLAADPDYSGQAFKMASEHGAAFVLDQIETSGLQGRGGAGFPAVIKWRAVAQASGIKYVVLNADEGEPGTFKDRALLVHRPDLVVEGLAISAAMVGATDVYCYLRGEFEYPRRQLSAAIERFQDSNAFPGVEFHIHVGHGAYICGEETALLEALEGKRGMPRLKPPFPTEHGLWGRPTLIHNVETIACVPSIVRRGGEWFQRLGRTGAGSKLYNVSGDVVRPGTYELPLGVTLDELVEEAGGYVGTLQAFSPGGASSGFLPAAERNRPLDFRALAEAGSMLGSAGVVVLSEESDLVSALLDQLRFFEDESCGQCAPCRIGTRYLRRAVDQLAHGNEAEGQEALEHAEEVAWEMVEGSICGLGQAAPLPLTSLLRHFPDRLRGQSS